MDNIKTALELITKLAFNGVAVTVTSFVEHHETHSLPQISVGLFTLNENLSIDKEVTTSYSSNIYRDEEQFVTAVKNQYFELLKEIKHEEFFK